MASYKVHSRVDNVKINKKFKNKQSGYRPKACQYGDIWTPESYPSTVRRKMKNNAMRRYYEEWMDCELHRDSDSIIVLDHDNYDNIPIWQCKLCTYLNVERLAFCAMCNHPFNFNFTHNETNINYITYNRYNCNPYRFNSKNNRKRKRIRKRNKKISKCSNTDFKVYWDKMNEIKQFQLKYWQLSDNQCVEQQIKQKPKLPNKHKVYLSKIFVTHPYTTYHGKNWHKSESERTEIWSTTFNYNHKMMKITLYQTDGMNKYYDLQTITNIPIMFDSKIFSQLRPQRSALDTIRNKVYTVIREQLQQEKCEFAAKSILCGCNDIDTLDLSGYNKLYSAKELRVKAREHYEENHIFRNRFVSNEHDMNIEVKFLILNHRLQQVMVDINIKNGACIEYECNTTTQRGLNMFGIKDMALFQLCQGCFNCEGQLRAKNTVVWLHNYTKYWALDCQYWAVDYTKESAADRVSIQSIESVLRDVFPKDICRIALGYLYYDLILIVQGKVDKNWKNFCVVGDDARAVGRTYSPYWTYKYRYYDWKRYFGYSDKSGHVRYFDKRSGMEGIGWAKVTECGEHINEYNWLDDYSTGSSAPIPDLFQLFGHSDSDSDF